MTIVSATKGWEQGLILTEIITCLIQFTHTKQRGTKKHNISFDELGKFVYVGS